MRDALVIGLLSILPRKLVARGMGAGTRIRLPAPLNRALLRWYVRKYGVNLSEMEGGIEDYPCLGQFFIRRLLPGARPVAEEADAVVSPADGLVYVAGKVTDGKLPQSPDLDYAVATLLGGDARYEGGDYCVIYLSPKDYHRVHTPREGEVIGHRYLPGRLWPVFPAATRKIRDLFALNERLVIRLRTDAGEIAQVMVGAFGVGRMATVYSDLITNTRGPGEDLELPAAHPLPRAGEVARFEMGSTVVLVTEPGRVVFEAQPGDKVQVGQRIGRVLPT